jgi:CRISPR-associated protein Cas1
VTRDLRELPKLRDSLSYLYLEYGHIERDLNAVKYSNAQGIVPIPIAGMTVLLLGPGTTISHEAVKVISGNGCSIIWSGEDFVRFYASGTGETRKASHLIRQAQLWADPELHRAVVVKMYRKRFPEELPETLTIQQIRGKEGVRVRECYAQHARKYGIEWKGRAYDRSNWNRGDPVNRALSAANSCLYGVCHAAIVSGGYSPALGFIHTGKQLSFVYDIADLYRRRSRSPRLFLRSPRVWTSLKAVHALCAAMSSQSAVCLSEFSLTSTS